MKFAKRLRLMLIIFSLLLGLILSGCNDGDASGISAEERQRLELYVAVMKEAFAIENGGNNYIAVRMDSLDGLSDAAKAEVLKELASLSPRVYSYDDIKDDTTKFGRGGTVLSVYVEEYSKGSAVISASSWFGSLGAVYPKFNAAYKRGKWNLEMIGFAIS